MDIDNLLNISTRGIVHRYADKSHAECQATPSYVLDKLVQSGYIIEDNAIVDYGCGKGRVAFYLNHVIGCRVTGVEYAEPIYQIAEKNLDNYGRDKGVEFVNCPAEKYVPNGADTFYFYDPFSLETVERVVENILACPTAKQIIFYYPPKPQEEFLLSHPELALVGSIDCRLISYGNKQNKIMIFRRIKK